MPSVWLIQSGFFFVVTPRISLENGIAQNLPWSLIYSAHHQEDLSYEDDLKIKVNFVVVLF